MNSTAYVLSIVYKGSVLSALVYDEHGRTIGVARREFAGGRDDFAVLHPDDLLSSLILLLDSALRKACILPHELIGVGIAAPEDAVVLWDENSGSPLGPVRFLPFHAKDFTKDIEPLVRTWILEAKTGEAKIREGSTVLLGGIESWLIWNLSHGAHHVIASSHRLLGDATSPKDAGAGFLPLDTSIRLAKSVTCASRVGQVAAPFLGGIPVPITAVATTSVSTLFGAGLADEHEAFVSYDFDGGFITLCSAQDVQAVNKSATTFLPLKVDAPNVTTLHALLLAKFESQNTILQWLQNIPFSFPNEETLKRRADLILHDEQVTLTLASQSSHRAVIAGIGPTTTLEEIYVAALRAIVTAVSDAVQEMNRLTGKTIYRLYTDHTGFGNEWIYTLQTNVANVPLYVRSEDTGSLGIAFLAGMGANHWDRTKIFEWLTQHISSRVYEAT